jgi:hypothetical protein
MEPSWLTTPSRAGDPAHSSSSVSWTSPAAHTPLAERDYGDLVQVVIPASGGPARVERSRYGP